MRVSNILTYLETKYILGFIASVAVIVIALFFPLQVGFAGFFGFIEEIIIALCQWILQFEFWYLNKLTAITSELLSNTDIVDTKYVTLPWKVIRDMANIAFIGVLLVISIMNIIGYEGDGYQIKSALPKLVLGVIGVNFSKLICGVILDFMNVITATMYGFVGGGILGKYGEGIYQYIVQIYSLSPENGEVALVQGTKNILTDTVSFEAVNTLTWELIFVMVLVGLLATGFSWLAVLFLVRMAWLWIMTVLSPLYFVGVAFSGFSEMQNKIQEKFLNMAMMPVKVAAVLAISFRMHSLIVTEGSDFTLGDAINGVWQGNISFKEGGGAVSIIGYLIIIAAVWEAYRLAKDDGIGDKVNNWIDDKFKSVGKDGGGALGKAFYKYVPVTGYGEAIKTGDFSKLKTARHYGEAVKGIYEGLKDERKQARSRGAASIQKNIGKGIDQFIGRKDNKFEKKFGLVHQNEVFQKIKKNYRPDQSKTELNGTRFNNLSKEDRIAHMRNAFEGGRLHTKELESVLKKGTGDWDEKEQKEYIEQIGNMFGDKHPIGELFHIASEAQKKPIEERNIFEQKILDMLTSTNPDDREKLLNFLKGNEKIEFKGTDADGNEFSVNEDIDKISEDRNGNEFKEIYRNIKKSVQRMDKNDLDRSQFKFMFSDQERFTKDVTGHLTEEGIQNLDAQMESNKEGYDRDGASEEDKKDIINRAQEAFKDISYTNILDALDKNSLKGSNFAKALKQVFVSENNTTRQEDMKKLEKENLKLFLENIDAGNPTFKTKATKYFNDNDIDDPILTKALTAGLADDLIKGISDTDKQNAIKAKIAENLDTYAGSMSGEDIYDLSVERKKKQKYFNTHQDKLFKLGREAINEILTGNSERNTIIKKMIDTGDIKKINKNLLESFANEEKEYIMKNLTKAQDLILKMIEQIKSNNDFEAVSDALIQAKLKKTFKTELDKKLEELTKS